MVQRMLPPPKGPGKHPGGHRARPPRQSCQVLAERSLNVVPVGAWVESGPGELEESLAFASASRVEEELKEQQRQKAARLRRFQAEVKQRVRQQLQLRRKQQLQESYEALSRSTKQARLRLASCRTVPPGLGPPELPGGVWRREPPEPWEPPAEDEGELLQPAGHRRPRAEPQEQGTAPPGAKPGDDFYIKIAFKKCCAGSVQASSSPKPPQRPHTHHHTPPVLWAGADQEETKKQRRCEQLRLRHLLMGIERQQVREQQRQQEKQRRIHQIKSKKENQCQVEEQRMLEMAEQRGLSPGEGASETLAQLQLEERRVEKVKEKQQRHKERVRYLEALRAQLKEKVKLCHIDLPPLCSCGSSFWDSHPDTCANNCIFYKNHKAYSRALCSLLSSCEPQGRSSSAKLLLRDLAALCGKL
ncbi:coiled-coil domain-containing protein 15 [Pogoniulus pusillus]|uniref:coiled-coil domain-containing protein 15 n=1 Tax=Pogoniulus pusillus TaxID=488313 RepID=UPI0030B9557B